MKEYVVCCSKSRGVTGLRLRIIVRFKFSERDPEAQWFRGQCASNFACLCVVILYTGVLKQPAPRLALQVGHQLALLLSRGQFATMGISSPNVRTDIVKNSAVMKSPSAPATLPLEIVSRCSGGQMAARRRRP
jgi:hypothetical protein